MSIQKNYNTPMATMTPPPYEEHDDQKGLVAQTCSPLSQLQLQPIQPNFGPIVIPQVSKTFRGAFFSPFSRAYSPVLQAHSIDPAEFLFFLDGLNEAFIAHPVFQYTANVGNVMAFAPLPSVRFTGIGLAVGSGLASAAVSYTRTRAYVKAANEDMFLPRGLKCKILKTKKMMKAVGRGDEVLSLPPLDMLDEKEGMIEREEDDPRMRRVRALGNTVAPLTFEALPAPEDPEQFWKRMSYKQAKKADAKMHKKLMKERRKGVEKYYEKVHEAQKEGAKCDKDIDKVRREREKEIAKAEKKLSGKKGRDAKERRKIEEDLEDELRKCDKKMEKEIREKEKKVGKEMGHGEKDLAKVDKKEQKIARKIYWIVIDKAERMDRHLAGVDDVEDAESETSA